MRPLLILIKRCEELNYPFTEEFISYILFTDQPKVDSYKITLNIQFKRINEYSSGRSPTLNTTDMYNGIMLLYTSVSNG